MEGEGATDQDFDELDKLLEEIPSVTSEPRAGEPNVTDPSPELPRIPMEEHEKRSPSTKFTGLYTSPRAPKNGDNMVFYGGLTFSENPSDQKFQSNGKADNANSGYETPVVALEHHELSLPDSNSLELALKKLSLKHAWAMKPVTAAPVKNNNAPTNHSFLVNGLYPNHLNDSLWGLGSIEMPTPPMATNLYGASYHKPQLAACSPFTSTDGFSEFNGNFDGQYNTIFPRLVDHGLNNQKPERLQGNFEEQWASPAMHAYQFAHRVPVPGLELPASAYQSRPHLGQSDMEWRDMKGGYFYPRQFQNQGSTAQQIPIGARPLDGSTMQPYFEMPTHRHIEQGSQNSYWNGNYVHGGYNQFSLSATAGGLRLYCPQGSCGEGKSCRIPYCLHSLTSADVRTRSAYDFPGHQVLDKVEKQYHPEKNLTSLQGVNSLRSLSSESFDYMTTNQSPPPVDNNRQTISGGQVRHPLVLSNVSLHLDDQNSLGSSPNIFGLHPSKPVQMEFISVDEVVGRIPSVAKDQHGCRFLQSKFKDGTPDDVRKIFVEIIDHIVELVTDPFGNYLVQKLVEVGSEEQRMHIVQAITRKAGELIRISCDMHGTRVVQKVILTVKNLEQLSMIVSSLKPGIMSLIMDVNGNHVAQHCLERLPPEYKEFVVDAAVAHCVEVATDRQGCCVLQKGVSFCVGDQKRKLMSKLCSNSLVLSQDQYGNYVVQILLDQKIPWVTAAILDQLEGHYEHLSRQKYSSNVVERCLKMSEEGERAKIISELTSNSHLLRILQDQFGNYVIQSALRECKGAVHAALVEAIRTHAAALRSCQYGKKVLSRILPRFH